MRADLHRGVQASQIAHAAAEAFGHPPVIVVALTVPDEASLRQLAVELGSSAALVVEDAGPHARQATALGIVKPIEERDALRRKTSALPLVK